MPELKSIHDLKHHIRKLARDSIVDIENVVIRNEQTKAIPNSDKLIYDGDLYFEIADPARGPNRIAKVPFFVIGHFIAESDSVLTFEDPKRLGAHHHFRLNDFRLEKETDMAHEFYIFNVSANLPLKVKGFDRFDTKNEAKQKLEEWMEICKDRQPAPKYVVRARTKQS